jgi:hypothetical protein
MISHGIKCRHCHSNMSEPRLVQDGPKKGLMRTYCLQCGHLEHTAPVSQTSQYQQQGQSPKPPQVPAAPFGARLLHPRKPT